MWISSAGSGTHDSQKHRCK